MTLIEALQTIPDYRKARGKRHPLWIVLVVIVMGNLAGYWGNRPLEEFAKRYGKEIAAQLQIELSSLPSYSTFRGAHLYLDFDAVNHAFREWMIQYLTIDEETYAIDGKRIGQSVTGEESKTRFLGLVSVFAQQLLSDVQPTMQEHLRSLQVLSHRSMESGTSAH